MDILDLSEKSVLVVGLARDCAKSIEADVGRISRALGDFGSVSWLVIESDSADDTPAVLTRMAVITENFRYQSLGNLSRKISDRTGRIAYCRNRYLQEIHSDLVYEDIDYVVVADLDGINRLIDIEGVRSCFTRLGWDACMANQRGPYYDMWALRHEVWCPNDCWTEYQFLTDYSVSPMRAMNDAVYSKMITIPPESPWIEVESGFGGFVIYRKEAIVAGEYIGHDGTGRASCEHVSLHRGLRAAGFRLFINPKLINCGLNEHNRQKYWIFKLRAIGRVLLQKMLSEDRFDKLKVRFGR